MTNENSAAAHTSGSATFAGGDVLNETETLTRKLRRSRTLNIILGAAAAFLLVVAIAQPLSQQKPALNLGNDKAPSVAPTDGAPAADGQPEETVDPNRPVLAEQIAKADPNDPMAYGDIDAPLTVIEWTDYRCPFCAKFTNDTMPVVLEEYVDKGLVRYEVRDVSFFGDDSTAAAVAARAAGNQGKFAEYFEAIYAAAPQSGHPDMPREKLIGFAEQVGVPDIAQFTADLDDPTLAAAVATSTTEAQQLGVTAVPFFVVGGTYFSGAQPIETFHKVITEQLELAKVE
ncbi:DsbA family protein [Microbacterium sp. NC79]|uniref:DsbA family protein n=1 Tax=Microbacterium sp. NC79 TaxID=2851009 RepID=UPI00349FC52E